MQLCLKSESFKGKHFLRMNVLKDFSDDEYQKELTSLKPFPYRIT